MKITLSYTFSLCIQSGKFSSTCIQLFTWHRWLRASCDAHNKLGMEELPLALVAENTPMLELLVGGNLECSTILQWWFVKIHSNHRGNRLDYWTATIFLWRLTQTASKNGSDRWLTLWKKLGCPHEQPGKKKRRIPIKKTNCTVQASHTEGKLKISINKYYIKL